MKNKSLYLIIGLIIIILIVIGAFVSLQKSQKSKTVIEDKSPNNLNYLASQGKVLPVLVSEAGAVPSSIKINKGEAINFTNTTKQDLEIRITGASSLYVVKIPAGKTQISPILSIVGAYKFTDSKNPKISGVIVVE